MTKFLKKLQEVINPTQKVETQTTILQKKAGTYKVECTIDEEVVDCEEISSTPYTGVPAPEYLQDDPWFSTPIKSEKQLEYMQQEIEVKRQERENNFSVEPDDIHQKMYEIATKNQNTTLDLDPISPGGSENFHEGPGRWSSGTGQNQFR